MNPKLFLAIFSFKDELKYVALAFLIALSIPIIAVILLTHVGIDIISDRLATWVRLVYPEQGRMGQQAPICILK